MLIKRIHTMKKIIFLVFLSHTIETFSMTEAEEAIILNQELQFLKESVKNIEVNSKQETPVKELTQSKPLRSLEEAYFDDFEDDEVTTRSSSRKRNSE